MDYRQLTALVTGASSGIGADVAREFARRGSNVVLVARRADRLEALADECRAVGVQATVVSVDLASAAGAARLAAALETAGITVDVLVNNAGFGTAGWFAEEDPDRVREEIDLNVLSVVDLTRRYLPGMLARGHGAVVNIASTASFQPVPGMAVYGATKAFVRSFTEALWQETRGTGVRVFAINPGATPTEFFEVAGATPGGQMITVASVVKTVFDQLDHSEPAPSRVVGGLNALLAGLASRLPRRFVLGLAARMFLPGSPQPGARLGKPAA